MSSVLIRSLRHATEADHAAEADYAVNADEATNADTAKNAGTVGGYAPNGLLRAARATPTSSVALTVSYQTLATLSITAPSPGFVIVNSTVKVQSVTCPCAATARFPVGAAGTQSYVLEAYESSGSAMSALDGVISAIFVPFGSTGGTGL